MPVGTQATVKSLASGDLEALGAQIVSGNTYHLAMRPGGWAGARPGRAAHLHGLAARHPHGFGGYQVFSHNGRRKIDDDGVTFHSHVDGSEQRLTPESAMAIQADLGSDVAMAFDECPASDASREVLVRGDGADHQVGASLCGQHASAGTAALRHRARGH